MRWALKEPTHFNHFFKKQTNMTPSAFARSRLAGAIRPALYELPELPVFRKASMERITWLCGMVPTGVCARKTGDLHDLMQVQYLIDDLLRASHK